MTTCTRNRSLRIAAGSARLTSRLDTVLLSSVGALVAHQAAYSIAPVLGQGSLVGHGHLGFVWKLSLLAAVVGMTGIVVRSLRSRRYRIANPVGMGTTIAASFTSLELLERAAEGISPTILFTEIVFWLGLAAILPITFVLTFFLQAVSEAATKFVHRQPAPQWPTLVVSATRHEQALPISGFGLFWSRWGRGPPVSERVNFS